MLANAEDQENVGIIIGLSITIGMTSGSIV